MGANGWAIPALSILWISGACAGIPERPSPNVAPDSIGSAVRGDTLPDGRSPSGIVDGEDDLLPDPRDRTWMRLHALRVLIQRYADRHGSLPGSIGDFLPPGREGAYYRIDAWGEEISYSVRGKSYEFRSRGPDRQLNTSDDLVMDKATVVPGPFPPGG